MPLAAWRENSSRHVASLRRIRLLFFIAPVSSTITGRDYPQWTDLRKYVAELPVTGGRAPERLEVIAEQLTQVRRQWSVPGLREDLAGAGQILVNHGARTGRDDMAVAVEHRRANELALELGAIVAHRGIVAAQTGRCRRREPGERHG